VRAPARAGPDQKKAGKPATREEKRQWERDSAEYRQWGQPMLDTLKSLQHDHTTSSGKGSRGRYVYTTDEAHTASLKSLKVQPADVAKVTENRITQVWIHPAEHKLLVCAADKSGYVGLWDVDAKEEKHEDEDEDEDEDEREEAAQEKRKKLRRIPASTTGSTSTSTAAATRPIYTYGNRYKSRIGVGGVFKYRPHVSAVCRIYSTAAQRSNIHTVSYDGTGKDACVYACV